MNWGYHILTDTLGLATAFAAAYYAARVVNATGVEVSGGSIRYGLRLGSLLLLSSLAFLARETAWFAVVTTTWLVVRRAVDRQIQWALAGAILLVLPLGCVPQIYYSHLWGTSGVSLRSSLGTLLDLRYVIDFVVKTAICFNIAWIPALLALRTGGRGLIPQFSVGWTIGSILYMAAGYFHNSQAGVGYPLRLSYALFPLVFMSVGAFFERRVSPPRRSLSLGSGFCVVQYGISLIGVFADPGRSHFRTTDLFQALTGLLGR